MAVVEHGAPPAPCVPPPRCLPPALPGDILRVLNGEEPAGRAALNVGDVIIKNLGAKKKG